MKIKNKEHFLKRQYEVKRRIGERHHDFLDQYISVDENHVVEKYIIRDEDNVIILLCEFDFLEKDNVFGDKTYISNGVLG